MRITIKVAGDNDMRDWSPGEGKCEWLATTQLPSISNMTDSIGWWMPLVHIVSVSVQVE